MIATCPKCGYPLAEDSNFCPRCGEKLREHTGDTTRVIPVVVDESDGTDDLPEEIVQAIGQLPKGHALLVVQRGPDSGARYLLDSEKTIAGRQPSSDIFLDDITVSRNHAQFTRTAAQMTVTDMGSLNGTYVNRTLIDGTVVLRTGDEVQIGKYRLVYFESPLGLA